MVQREKGMPRPRIGEDQIQVRIGHLLLIDWIGQWKTPLLLPLGPRQSETMVDQRYGSSVWH